MKRLTKEEVKAACAYASRNKNLSNHEMDSLKSGFCGILDPLLGEYVLCLICHDKIPKNSWNDEGEWVLHIREHLKDLKIFL